MKKSILNIFFLTVLMMSGRAYGQQMLENGWPQYFKEATHFLWSGSSWAIDMRLTPHYNSSNRISYILGESPAGNSWNNAMKIFMNYDGSGRPAIRIQQLYQNNAWVDFSMDSLRYDDALLPNSCISYHKQGNSWVRFTLSHYIYNNDGQLAELLQENVNSGTGHWQNDEDYIYVYDKEGHMVTIVNNDWKSSKWVPKGIANISINGKGKVASIMTLHSNGTGWTNSEKLSFIIDSSSGIGPEEMPDVKVTLYPNPAGSQLQIGLPFAIFRGEVRIYDMRGRLVLSQQEEVNGNIIIVDVKALPSGSYMLRCVTSSGQANTQFIKE